jgi:CRP-like cAMP-binding protein
LALVNDNPRVATVHCCELPQSFIDDPKAVLTSPKVDILCLTVERADYLRIAREVHHKEVLAKMNLLVSFKDLAALSKTNDVLKSSITGHGAKGHVVKNSKNSQLLATIASVMNWHTFSCGDTIVHEGDRVSEFYFIKEGYVDIYRDIMINEHGESTVMSDKCVADWAREQGNKRTSHRDDNKSVPVGKSKKSKVFRVRVARKGPGEYFGEEYVIKWNQSNYLSK